MRAFVGKTKVLLLAFGHPDNVLSLANAISEKVTLSVIFLVTGNQFRQGILDLNLKSLSYKLSDHKTALELLPENIKQYIGDNFSIRFIHTPSLKLIRKGALKNFLIIYKACQQLNSEKYDILHFNGMSGFTLYFRLFLKSIKRKIWTIHDYIPHTGEESQKVKLLNKLSVLKNFEYIQHYLWLKKNFTQHFKIPESKVHHVYSGPFDVIKTFNPVTIISETNYFLFFGRISKYKGLEFLINSYNKFKGPGKPKLVIAGNGNMDFLPETIDLEGIRILNSYISSEELCGLIINSLAVVIPYSDSTHSGVIMTAYSFNKPVIATNVGGLNEVVINDKTGLLVKYEDEESLVHSFEKFSSNPEILKYYENNIKELCATGKLSWAHISQQMAKIYDSSVKYSL